MNERIRVLAEQCMVEVKNVPVTGIDGWTALETVRQIDPVTFAELIVKDCVSTLTDMHMWQSVNNQNYPSAWHDAVDQGIDTIKQHFGVE